MCRMIPDPWGSRSSSLYIHCLFTAHQLIFSAQQLNSCIFILYHIYEPSYFVKLSESTPFFYRNRLFILSAFSDGSFEMPCNTFFSCQCEGARQGKLWRWKQAAPQFSHCLVMKRTFTIKGRSPASLLFDSDVFTRAHSRWVHSAVQPGRG